MIAMLHLLNRGYYKPMTASGETVRNALMTLCPPIYGSMTDPEKVELNGLVYVIDRLPRGIEECCEVILGPKEGLEAVSAPITPAKRRLECYRIDNERMNIEVTKGRSEVYDILTHLTFLYIESEKIRKHAIDSSGNKTREWKKLEEIVESKATIDDSNRNNAIYYLSMILGRRFDEAADAYKKFEQNSGKNNGLLHTVYWLGKRAMEERESPPNERQVIFKPTLREIIGHQLYGKAWANNIKEYLMENNLLGRLLHVVSANMHSFMNSLFAYSALQDRFPKSQIIDIAAELSKRENDGLGEIVKKHAAENGMHTIEDESGTGIAVQIYDTSRIDPSSLPPEIRLNTDYVKNQKQVILVMDYAFGEQAFETMDELLTPFEQGGRSYNMNVRSISIMGKAGALQGSRGDIIIPTAHIFEGTTHYYPLQNDVSVEDFRECDMAVHTGPMVTVLGTSLQNEHILLYFRDSEWGVKGLEMEGGHYQKAIVVAIGKKHIRDAALRYAYYTSDIPVQSGATLAAGSLGFEGVKSTYLITLSFLNKILNPEEMRNR